jgi:hypothetical protein
MKKHKQNAGKNRMVFYWLCVIGTRRSGGGSFSAGDAAHIPQYV